MVTCFFYRTETPIVEYITTLTNGCHNAKSFTLECFGYNFPKEVKFSLLLKNMTLFETSASFITYTHQYFDDEQDGSALDFECRADFESAGIKKRTQTFVLLPKCGNYLNNCIVRSICNSEGRIPKRSPFLSKVFKKFIRKENFLL